MLLHRPDHPEVGAEAWAAAVARSETATVFQTRLWHASWWHVFGDDRQGHCVVTTSGGQPIGIVPLAVEARAPGVIRFMGDGRADYCDIIAAPGDKPAVLKAMFETIDAAIHWEKFELNNVPAASTTISVLRRVCWELGYRVAVHEQFRCPTLLIQGHAESARHIYNKASLRRPETALRKAGPVTCETVRTGAAILPLLDLFFDQHVRRWRHTPTPSLFEDTRNREFYRELTRRFADTGSLHFTTLTFAGQPIAFHFGFDHGGVMTWYKPSFEIEQASRSPGMVLLRHLIGDAIANDRSELDFTVGDEPFKRRFTNAVRTTVTICVYRDPSAFYLDHSKRVVIDMAKHFSSRAESWRTPQSAGL